MGANRNVDEREFPRDGTLYLKLRFALRYAVLAPSSHNSQPWRFLVSENTVTISADRSRALPVVDPYDRELIISCGAALANLCVALAHFGIGFAIEAFPAEAEPDVVAVLRVANDLAPDPHLAGLFPAVLQRATNRGHFEPTPVPPELQERLRAEAGALGVSLVTATSEAQRARIAHLITQADTLQFADARFRGELASWIHQRRSTDGMPAYALGVPKLLDFEAPIAGMVLRTFDVGAGVAARNNALAQGSPLLLCLATAAEDPPDWLFAGQALERVLLLARLEGFDASYLNQPIEIAELRSQLGKLLQIGDIPQLLIRLGKGGAPESTPRRPLEEVSA